MAASKNNLIWIDLEMTGLDISKDKIIEIATVITNQELQIVAEGPEMIIHQPDELLASMDDWNKQHHGKSGLLQGVKNSTITARQAEVKTLEFITQYVPANTSPMCGNSICQDRRFLYRHMRNLEQYFHYRHVDVSTVKLLANYWYPQVIKQAPKKTSCHRAKDDIIQSIEELRFYKKYLFNN